MRAMDDVFFIVDDDLHPRKQTAGTQKLVVCRCFSFSKKGVLSGSIFVSGGVNLPINPVIQWANKGLVRDLLIRME